MKRCLSLTSVLLMLTLVGCGTDTAATTLSEPAHSSAPSAAPSETPTEGARPETPIESVRTGLISEQILSDAEGDIHYSYDLPESDDGSRKFPMMAVMPGYDMMWFGEESAGTNLNRVISHSKG